MSLYATGTITGALNATTITGTGTKWSDAKIGITNGSVLFVSSNAGVDGIYQVKRVISDTSIELAQPIYKTFTNSKYSILVAESASTAAWSNQLAATLGYYQAQMDGWQQIMTGTGDVALTAPDGTKVTIKSFTALDKDKMNHGAYGLGRGARFTMSDLGWASGFLMYNTIEDEVPANVCGWQSSYGNSRRAQLVMGTDGRLHARFSLSTEIIDTTTEWRPLLFRWEQTPRFEWGIEVSNKRKDDASGRIAYLGSNSAPNNAANGAVYLINRLGNKALQLMDNGTINFDNKDIPVFGQPNVNFGSGFKVSNTAGSQTYVTWSLANLGRPSTDNGGIVSIEISNTTGRPYLLQRRNDGTFTDQIVNGLPTAGGVLAVQGTSGREYKRDIADADATEALNRINELRFVNYVYKDDEQNRERFGFIAEEVEQIAPQYIKHMQELVEEILDPDTKEIIDRVYRDRPCVDNNPIVMDLLGAIQSLTSRVNEQEARLLALEKTISSN